MMGRRRSRNNDGSSYGVRSGPFSWIFGMHGIQRIRKGDLKTTKKKRKSKNKKKNKKKRTKKNNLNFTKKNKIKKKFDCSGKLQHIHTIYVQYIYYISV
jgi:hypothetical protein